MDHSRRQTVELDTKTLVVEHTVEHDGAATVPVVGSPFGERYQFVEPIGDGGMGIVVAQRDTLLGRRVAMKVMRSALRDHSGYRERFVREVRVQGQLEHPSVVPVYELGVAPDGDLFFTMKRVQGDTLLSILERHWKGDQATREKYSRRKLLAAMSSVCLAVQFAHERGVLHRDLKPENVMLGDFGEVYVLDWGLAHLMPRQDGSEDDAPLSRPGDVMGTPGYMSPEQAMGMADELTEASDVYALGAILFEVLAFQPLHPGETTEQLLAATLQGADAAACRRAPDRDVPPELEQLCIAATQLDRLDRPASARELHAGIERYLEGERDEELRKDVADRHAREAAHLVERAHSSDDISVRRRAMQELGRALALEPDNAEALEALVQLFTLTPRQVPPEVEQQMRLAQHERKVTMARAAAVAYPLILLFIPLLLWIGVRGTVTLLLFSGACMLAGAGSWWVGRHATVKSGDAMALAVFSLSTLGFALMTAFFGPLIIVPATVIVNTVLFAMYFPRRHRWSVGAIGVAGVGVPFALELGGVTHVYVATAGALQFAAHALSINATKMLLFGAAASVAGVVLGTVCAGYFRDALVESEGRLLMHDWHLRQILGPQAADSHSGVVPSSVGS